MGHITTTSDEELNIKSSVWLNFNPSIKKVSKQTPEKTQRIGYTRCMAHSNVCINRLFYNDMAIRQSFFSNPFLYNKGPVALPRKTFDTIYL